MSKPKSIVKIHKIKFIAWGKPITFIDGDGELRTERSHYACIILQTGGKAGCFKQIYWNGQNWSLSLGFISFLYGRLK